MTTQPILVAEDDENDVIFLRNACKKAELANPLHVVSDGQQAIDYLAETEAHPDRDAHPLPCLVLLDLNLPCKSGFEVLQWIREHEALRTLLVVVVTSSSAETDADRAYSLGANSYIVKPSNPEQLRNFVNLVKLYWLEWNYVPRLREMEQALSSSPGIRLPLHKNIM